MIGQLYRLRAPSTGREIVVDGRARPRVHRPRLRASGSRSSGRCFRSRRRSPNCPGPWRTCGSATGATSRPRRTSTTARPAAAVWPHCPADPHCHARGSYRLIPSHRRPAGVRRRRLRRRRPVDAAGSRPARLACRSPTSADALGTATATPSGSATPTPTPTATAESGTTAPSRPVRPTRRPRAGTDTGTDDAAGTDSGGTTAPAQEDSPAEDTPPPAGSDAEQFEDFCAQNPGAC